MLIKYRGVILFFLSLVSVACEGIGCEEQCHFLEKSPYQICAKPFSSGLYARASGGLSVIPKLTMGFESGTEVVLPNTVFDNGYDADVGVGYRFLSDWRAEIAVSHIYNLVKSNYSGAVSNNIYGGHVSVYTAFINAYYDFNFYSRFKPYIGGGVGYLNGSYQWQLNNDAPVNDYTTSYASPAAQVIAGVAYAVTSTFLLSLDYRYMGTPTDDMNISNQVDDVSSTTGRYQINYFANLVNLGVIYQF